MAGTFCWRHSNVRKMMKVHELSKKTGISNKELIVELGVKSHMSNVPDDLVAKYIQDEPAKEVKNETETVSIQDDVARDSDSDIVDVKDPVSVPIIPSKVVDEPVEEICPYTPEKVELMNRCLGNKSKAWKWRDLNG